LNRLLNDRIIFLGTAIDDFVANAIVARWLFLQMEDAQKDIHMYVNSPGGSVTAGMAIYDTMKFMSCDVVTYCIGQAASMATVLLTAGTKGKRYALPNSRVMIHQPSGQETGQTSDLSIAAKEFLPWKKTLANVLAKPTSQSIETDRKRFGSRFFHGSRRKRIFSSVIGFPASLASIIADATDHPNLAENKNERGAGLFRRHQDR
jgi:ATP-dependent Clp protease protease subunit